MSSTGKQSTLLVHALVAKAAATPSKLLFEYVNDDGLSIARLSYQDFEAKTRALAKRLAKHCQNKPQSERFALLVYPPGIDFIITFIACLRASIVAVPVYPPRGARNKDLSMFLAVHDSCKAKLALTNSVYNFASRVASMKDTISTMFTSKREDEGLGRWPDDLEWLVTDTFAGEMASDVEIDRASAADVAFLQYTSGSTSLPKGVVLTHGNLAHNLATIITALKADESVVVVSWLPMYHDMGLIGSHLGTIYCGGSATIFSPIAFVKNPPLWIELVSSRKGTHLQAPNFAYRLTVRKFLAKMQQQPPGKTYSLESVRHIFNAAEPIDPDTIDEFCDVFGKYGLRRDAMVPGYGLAEHTVYVCDGGRQRLVVSRTALEKQGRVEILNDVKLPDAMVLVGCGAPPDDSGILIRIVHPAQLRKLQDGTVGEIWVSSPSKSVAYFGLEEKTRTDLHARLGPNIDSEGLIDLNIHPSEESKRRESSSASLDGSSSPSGSFIEANEDELSREWLRTGDLGVWYHEELFICGRIKDLLIVRGRNHFPQDIEATTERCDRQWIRPGCSAAFTTLSEGEEHVAVCFEVRHGLTDPSVMHEIIAKVRASIAREHGIAPRSVVMLAEHSIPKTTSGKISRHRVKKAFLDNKLKLVSRWDRSDKDVPDEDFVAQAEGSAGPARQKPKITSLSGIELLTKLKEEAGALVERDPVTMDADAPMPELGFDSMMLTQFKAAVFNALGAELADEKLFDESCTLNRIREMIEEQAELQEQRRDSPAALGEASMTRAEGPGVTARSKERRPLIAGWKKGQKCGFCGC